jgi:hypothetical protein
MNRRRRADAKAAHIGRYTHHALHAHLIGSSHSPSVPVIDEETALTSRPAGRDTTILVM